jgi:aryl-alcohol dehydrogenase-like predicted oxidoreductase
LIPHVPLGDAYEISRIIKGGWHLAGDHGRIDHDQAVRDMATFVEAGITTFDCADIYSGVEEMIGEFRATYPTLARDVRVHTKYVPDLARLADLDLPSVEAGIDRSLRRLKVEALDLVQFHWWDFAVRGYVEAALALNVLREKGKIRYIGVTNFDVAHLQEIIAAGVPVLSHQLQYSLLDRRAEQGMRSFCDAHGIVFLCYGTVAGGFLSGRWLGQPEPAPGLTNRSLIKYKLIIDDFGGWHLFQELLQALDGLACKHHCDIATIATRFVLDADNVAAAIVGATNVSHLPAHEQIGTLGLDDADRAAIQTVIAKAKGPLGDVYTLERDRHGPHGRIMKYDLGK